MTADDATLVIHGEDAREAARRMLPRLPESCFVPGGRRSERGWEAAVEKAVADGVGRLVLVAGLGEQAAFVGGLSGGDGVLESVTVAMVGDRGLAAEVAEAPTIRESYELWEAAGTLGPCGRELCRRTAGELERLAADAAGSAGSPVAAQVVLIDPEGERMVGMYGRLAR